METQLERQKKKTEEVVEKNGHIETQLAATLKVIYRLCYVVFKATQEVEALQKQQKKDAAERQTLEVRLNRALEEVERTRSKLKEVCCSSIQ